MTKPKHHIGYLIPEFPGQTHAFFWREIQAFEDYGATVSIFSTRRPTRGSCPHAFGNDAEDRTTYLFPPSLSDTFRIALRHPRQVLRALRYVTCLKETRWRSRFKLFALIPSAAEMASVCQRRGIRHVHIHSCANAAHLGAIANLLTGLNYSLTLHGDLAVYGADHQAKMLRASFVSAVTSALQSSLRSEVGLDQPYPVIWMGVDTDRFHPGRNNHSVEAAVKLKVATVARLNIMKGHKYFLRAMALLRDEGIHIEYHIAGEGPERKAIEDEISRLGLQDRVTMLGAVDEERVLELLKSSDALALTSINMGEAAPVAVMEAMSCGLLPICSIIGGTPEMIDDGVDGFLIAQKDVEAIASVTRTIAMDPELRERMGRHARKTALEKFDHRVNAKLLFSKIDTSLKH